MNELDQRFARAREETEGLEAPSTLVHGILEGVRSRASQPPQVFSPLDPVGERASFAWSWVVGLLVVVLVGLAINVVAALRHEARNPAGVGVMEGLPADLATAVAPLPTAPVPARAVDARRPVAMPGRVVVVGESPAAPLAAPRPVAPVLQPKEPLPATPPGLPPVKTTAVSKPPSEVAPIEPPMPVMQVPGGKPELVGQVAYPFVAKTIDGQRVSLRDLRGKIVMIDVISIGCGFCFSELPDLKRIAKKTGVVIIGIADDTEADIISGTKRAPYPFFLVADPERRLLAHYPGAGTYPIGESRRVRAIG